MPGLPAGTGFTCLPGKGGDGFPSALGGLVGAGLTGLGEVLTLPPCCDRAICRSLCFCQPGFSCSGSPSTDLGSTEDGLGTLPRGLTEGGGPGAGLRPDKGEWDLLGKVRGPWGWCSSPSSESAMLRVRAFLINSGTSSSWFSGDMGLPLSCLGVLRS